MAWGMWFGTGAMKVTANETKTGIAKIIREGILLKLLNPKLSVFFLAFLPQFVTADSPNPTAEMALLGLMLMAMTFGVFVIYGCFAGALRSHIIERPKVMNWIGKGFAGVFIAMGAKLVLTAR
jgi:threonine/homoserine/homoserine lactone efflux protein